jgi:hypothetical protein
MTVKNFISAAMLIAEPLFAQTVLPAKALRPTPDAQDFDRGTYASIVFSVKNFTPALKRAEEHAGSGLLTRGEAHLTVLTPPEYMRIEGKLRKKILSEMKTADGDLKAVCIGRGQAELNGKMEYAYYVVVDAPAIRAIRQKYHLVDFYPHITLGFSKRDLHFEDGVRKDKTTCVADLTVAPSKIPGS